MANKLGAFFRAERLSRGISLSHLAQALGYRNVNKGIRRILRLERDGVILETLLLNLADVLGIDLLTVERLLSEDRQERLREWEQWANEPVPMRMIIRLMPAFHVTTPLPENVETAEEAERFACDFARRHQRRVCLVVSRRLSVWINERGKVEARTEATPDYPNVPGLWIKGDRRRFLFRFG